MFSAMFLPYLFMACYHDHAHLIIFTHACGYTIGGQLLILSQSTGYYSRVATNQSAASIQINMVL